MRTLLMALTTWLCAFAVHAQEDVAAGLFAEARQLPLVEQSLHVEVAAEQAVLHLSQVYVNDGDAVAQADFRLPLPQGATLTRFGFAKDGEMLWASLERKEDAEADHHAAASEGRTTGLASQRDGAISFSVYPLPQGARKRIELSLRVPVAYDMGQGRVRLPLDAFAGRSVPDTAITAEVWSDGPLVEWGVEPAGARTVVREDQRVLLAFSAAAPVELWWLADGPPLSVRARAVPLQEGLGLALDVTLRDAESWARNYAEVHLLIDASYSMRRRRSELSFVLDRVLSRSAVPVTLWGVAEEHDVLDGRMETQALVEVLSSGRFGHRATVDDFSELVASLGCAKPEVRCAVVSDGQLPGLVEAGLDVPVLLLSTADEVDQAEAEGGWPAGVAQYRSGADSEGLLAARVDPLVLPVLEIDSITLGGHPLELVGDPQLSVAEGGSLKAYALPSYMGEVEVRARIDGRPLVRTLAVEDLPPGDTRAKALRYGVYRSQLAAWMKDYRTEPSDALRERITQVSLREGIPTAFTSLQVDDPELSLYAVKPGDPLLRVEAEPGLERVVAYYPFGEVHELERDGTHFLDRFLVPRHWAERGYRIRIFKHYADGRIADVSAYYRLDDHGPEVMVWVDATRGQLVVDAGERIGDIARVEAHAESGRVHVLTPAGGRFRIDLALVGVGFDLFVRDRAGNRTRLRCTLDGGTLQVQPEPSAAVTAPPSAVPAGVLSARGVGLSVEAGTLRVAGPGSVRVAEVSEARLHSLRRTVRLDAGDGSVWLGTAAGDLLRLHDCDGEGRCVATPMAPHDWLAHPVTGLVELGADHLLVSVLGRGLFEVRAGRVERSRHRVGTLRISGLVRAGDDVLIGTATRGLWRLVARGGRWAAGPVRTRFEHAHVASLTASGAGVRVDSGFGSFLRVGRDRYRSVESPRPEGAPLQLTAAATFAGRPLVASFDRGLFVHAAEGLAPWPTELRGQGRHINALAVRGESLWVGSEGGLFQLDAKGRATRSLAVAVHGLDIGPGGDLAVASSEGLYLVGRDELPHRLDRQGLLPTARFTSVAFHGGALYAGSLDGLFRLEVGGLGKVHALSASEGFDAAWVTALASDGRRLFVGTYASGVREVTGRGLEPVPGLEGQWVPPGGLSTTPAGLWVGGLGMAPALVGEGGALRLSVPSLDVYAAAAFGGASWLLTSEGAVRVTPYP